MKQSHLHVELFLNLNSQIFYVQLLKIWMKLAFIQTKLNFRTDSQVHTQEKKQVRINMKILKHKHRLGKHTLSALR